MSASRTLHDDAVIPAVGVRTPVAADAKRA
jgi:hypothetical protein